MAGTRRVSHSGFVGRQVGLPEENTRKMHDLLIALFFVVMVASPCVVAARAGRNIA